MAKTTKKPNGKKKSSKKNNDEQTTNSATGQAWEKGKSVKCAKDESEKPEEQEENVEQED